METERYKQHLTYFGDYQIGQSLTVNMQTARTVEPYIIGKDMQEEMEHDFHVPLLQHGTIVTGFTKKQSRNPYLNRVMEQEITRILEEFQQSTDLTEMKKDDVNTVYCNYCQDNPCVWVMNKEDMIKFDELEDNLLTGEDIPPTNLCRKEIYHQIRLVK
jgi:hypothetical protein